MYLSINLKKELKTKFHDVIDKTYQKTIALRTVTSTDAMTAGIGELPWSFLSSVAAEIVQKVSGINRVVYDITTKPPATIEWE